jgi:hypothetical protein
VAPTPNKKLKQSSPWCLKTKMGDWISQVIRHLSKFQPTCGSRCGPMVCLCSMATYPFSHASKGGWWSDVCPVPGEELKEPWIEIPNHQPPAVHYPLF